MRKTSRISYSPGLHESRPCFVQRAAWQDSWDNAVKDKVTQKSWQIFKDTLFKAQEWLVQTLRKPSKYGREWPKMGEESDYLEKGRHCLSMQDADIKSQSSAGAETSYRCEKQKWGRLQYWQQNNNYIVKRWNHCSTEQGPNGKGDGKIKTT